MLLLLASSSLAFAASSSADLGLCGLPCDTNGVCIRREGVNDTCQCNEGYRLREDGVTCEGVYAHVPCISIYQHSCTFETTTVNMLKYMYAYNYTTVMYMVQCVFASW